MNYKIAVHTDVGIKKGTNQDSLCVKQAQTKNGNVLMAVMCDGMGGLEKGEIASATMINVFSTWFEKELPYCLANDDYVEEVRCYWARMMKTQNEVVAEYGRENNIQLGTTITAFLIFENGQYIIGHVGDSRAYKVTDSIIEVITEDHTVVANEVKHGRLTPEQAAIDSRRNVLIQCIGASRIVEPEFYYGKCETNECYMLCSDGFRHEITMSEIKNAFAPSVNLNENVMKNNIVRLVEINKERNEQDNISAILIKIE